MKLRTLKKHDRATAKLLKQLKREAAPMGVPSWNTYSTNPVVLDWTGGGAFAVVRDGKIIAVNVTTQER